MVKQAPDSYADATKPGISARQGDPILHGLNFLSSTWNGTGWGRPASNIWLTAYVLSRLAELDHSVFDHALGQKIQASCDWLLASRMPEGHWNDLSTIAHVVSALKSLGQDPGLAALQYVEHSASMAGRNGTSEWNVIGAALAVKATGKALPASCEAVGAALEPEGDLSQLWLCAEVLDWPHEVVPPALAARVRAILDQMGEDSADRITLLRCLLRLGRSRAWEVAAELKSEQLSDGSWHEPGLIDQITATFGPQELRLSDEDKKVLITASAIAALAIGQAQPGLYFGSHEPAPRRLRVVKVTR